MITSSRLALLIAVGAVGVACSISPKPLPPEWANIDDRNPEASAGNNDAGVPVHAGDSGSPLDGDTTVVQAPDAGDAGDGGDASDSSVDAAPDAADEDAGSDAAPAPDAG